MKLTIASGKGGTGKTTVAVNLAWTLARHEGFSGPVQLLDCDVEEPNDHLFVQPEFTESARVQVMKPVWDPAACTGCGECARACRFNAMAVVKGNVLIFPELCHACGVCTAVCPERAISEQPAPIGVVEYGRSRRGDFEFGHGVLELGESLAPTVVRAVKARIKPGTVAILDASPGTACPVVEAVDNADVALLVTEPTPFGLHDLKLAVGLTLGSDVPTGIIVNRSDGEDRLIEEYARRVGTPILGRIPFRREYAEAYSRGEILADRFPELYGLFFNIWLQVRELASAKPAPPPPEEDLFEVTATGAAAAPPADAPGAATDHTFREITVISGKGGTGKTTVVAALAHLLPNKVLSDNDVDAADLHLLLAPRVRERHEFRAGLKAVIDLEACIGCGRCAAACHFDAIHPTGPVGRNGRRMYRVNPFACEGCGLGPLVCPVDAISTEQNANGEWFVSDTPFGRMVHARLGIAEENSGKLVTQVRDRAATEAVRAGAPYVCADGPPGTGCPVISSVSGTDLVVIVTEPTVSGVHDMERVFRLTDHFGVPAVVLINKADLNPDQSARIHEIARTHGSRVIAQVPFDPEVSRALGAGKSIVEWAPAGPSAAALEGAVRALFELLHTEAEFGTKKRNH